MYINYLPLNNQFDVVIKGMENPADASEITDATPTFTIYEDDETTVVTGASAVSMTYQSSGGHYRGSTNPTLTRGDRYKVVVTDTTYNQQWVKWYECKTRPFGD